MLVDIKSVICQPEVPRDIRDLASAIAQQLTPFEGLMEPGKDSDEQSQLVFSILRQEDAVDAELVTTLNAYATCITDCYKSILRAQQATSARRRNLRRVDAMLDRWWKELSDGQRGLTAMLLRDAQRTSQATLIEVTTPHPRLRPTAKGESLQLVSSGEKESLQHERILGWINYRDRVVSHTTPATSRALRQIIAQTSSFAKDLDELLDLNLAAHPRFNRGYITIEPSPEQGALLQLKHLQIQCQDDVRDRAVVVFALTPLIGPAVGLQVSRLTGELVPHTQHYMSAKPMFANYGHAEIYDALRGICAYFLYECLSKGHLEVRPWIDPTLPDEPADAELPDQAPEPEPPAVEPSPQIDDPHPLVTPPTEKKKVTQFARGKVTWRNIMWTFRSYGISVEWNGHPMLCKDGKRVRYPNPHDSDARTNTRFLTHALKAFGIPRQEFYDRLFA